MSRAIPPQVAGVDPHTLRMPAAFDTLAAPPVFLAGTGRAGKTLTLDLFSAHPEVCTVFESWLLTASSGVAGIFRQPQWSPEFYAQQKERIGHEHAAVQLVSYQEAAAALGDLLAEWMMRRIAPHERFLVEKTPMDTAALAALFPKAKLIHVYRDGRDVVRSVRAAAKSWAPEMDNSLTAQAAHWAEYVRELRLGAVLLGDNYLELRFEDQRADIAATARHLYDFCGIPYDDELVATVVQATRPEAYSEAARASGFRGKGMVGGWRSSMTRAEGQEFDAAAGDLLVELGYAEDRTWWRALPRHRRGA